MSLPNVRFAVKTTSVTPPSITGRYQCTTQADRDVGYREWFKTVPAWLECPVSSCITEWMNSSIKFCELSIPTFAHRAERLLLVKKNALKTSKNMGIRELWSSTLSALANSEMDQRITSIYRL